MNSTNAIAATGPTRIISTVAHVARKVPSRARRFRIRHVALATGFAMVACSVSEDQEVAMGRADAAHVDSVLPIVHDSLVDRFITTLGQSMASRTSRSGLEWHFAVVNSAEVNAFALPGGYIYVNRGAIEQAERFDELAGVMGHEIGHVVRRHSVDQLQKRERQDLGLLMLCTLTRICHTIGGQVLVGVSADAMTARYSRLDEAQADSEGVVNTVRAGIDPEGLPSFFEALLDKQRSEPSAVDAFFSTHPTDQARISGTRRQIAELTPRPESTLIRDTPEFHAIQAQVRAWPRPPTTRARAAQ